MKKLIFSALILAAMGANARIIRMGGTFSGTVSGGNIKGTCNPSSSTCWEYDTDTKKLTIQLLVVTSTEPVISDTGEWEATYEE